MARPWGVREIGAVGLLEHHGHSRSFFSRASLLKTFLVGATWLLLAACGSGWARSSPHVRMQGAANYESVDWARPRAIAWGPGGARFGNQRGQQQQRSQQHLPQWFRQHQNMPPQAQERALRNEPGFNRLAPREQQRLVDRLHQLDAMPPGQRQRTLQRMEAFEKLSPEQRQQIHNVMQQVSQLPIDRRRMMHKAFRDLSQLPPEQRQAIMNSPQFKNQFSEHERQIMGSLMNVQPYLPLQRPGDGVEYGGKQ